MKMEKEEMQERPMIVDLFVSFQEFKLDGGITVKIQFSCVFL